MQRVDQWAMIFAMFPGGAGRPGGGSGRAVSAMDIAQAVFVAALIPPRLSCSGTCRRTEDHVPTCPPALDKRLQRPAPMPCAFVYEAPFASPMDHRTNAQSTSPLSVISARSLRVVPSCRARALLGPRVRSCASPLRFRPRPAGPAFNGAMPVILRVIRAKLTVRLRTSKAPRPLRPCGPYFERKAGSA